MDLQRLLRNAGFLAMMMLILARIVNSRPPRGSAGFLALTTLITGRIVSLGLRRDDLLVGSFIRSLSRALLVWWWLPLRYRVLRGE